MSEIDPAPREEVKEALEAAAKAGDVYHIANGLAFVPKEPDRTDLGGTGLFEKFHWVIGGIHPNYDDEQHELFVFPATAFDNGDRR